MEKGIKSEDKLLALKEFIKLQSNSLAIELVESNASKSEAVPVLMVSADVVQAMFKQIASTNEMLNRLLRRPMDLWLTWEQTLKFFDVSENTLRTYINRGWLACTVYERQKYFHWSDIEKFLLHPNHRRRAFQLDK